MCSYNIQITKLACGKNHTVFITPKGLTYTMGDNSRGQLGIDDTRVGLKFSPILIESLVKVSPVDVDCGNDHTLLLCASGKVYSWGSNQAG